MATVINNPSTHAGETRDDSSAGIIIGILVAILVVALFVIYGLPRIREATPATQPNTTTNVSVTNPPQGQTPNTSGNTGNTGGSPTTPPAGQTGTQGY